MTEMLLVGNLNNLQEQPHDWCEDKLATIFATHRLEDQPHHLILRHRYRGAKGWTCRMWKYRILVTGKGDYIVVSDHQ